MVTLEKPDPSWAEIRDRLRARGLRWTPQRRTILEVLEHTDGHITGSQLVERCQESDPETTPSTVYRTLRVLEDLGVVRHAHGLDGREEFHVRPGAEHGHLFCEQCGSRWEIEAGEAASVARALERSRDFELDVSHLTIVGRCSRCREANKLGG